MRVVHNYAPIEDYLRLLLSEATLITAHFPAHSRIDHIHFGGGSPSILTAEDFTRLVGRLRDILPISQHARIDIEADPRMAEPEKIAAYVAAGVRRLSLGVQDFNQDVLAAVNRPQPYELTASAVDACREHGIAVNFDLMYGLPGQSEHSIRRTLNMAADLQPDRIAFFGYAHVPWMKKHMSVLSSNPLPDASDRYDMAIAGMETLEDAGYLAIGIDHFCLPDDTMATALHNHTLRRNFQGYTTDACDGLIGLGASSICDLPQGYAQNTPDFKTYREKLEQPALAITRGYVRQPGDLMYASIIENLMCYLNTDIDKIAPRFGFDAAFFDMTLSMLDPYIDAGLILRDKRHITIIPEARLITRNISRYFDHHTPAPSPTHSTRHSRAV